ncbi:MAG: winged helix-turn-helix domain-containing protein, partial [Myxococcota bacterium]
MRVERGEIVLHQHLVMTEHGPVTLTPSERQLLEYLTARPHQVVPLEEVLEVVWGYAPHSRSQAVHVAIRRLRRKIEVDPTRPRHLKTVAGAGWMFEPLPAATVGLIGRALDRERLEAALAEAHRVCLTGPPGIGKTALARALGRGPVVELGGAPTFDEALARIASAVSCRVDELAERLGGRATIVVLDQAEHLVEPLGDWLEAVPATFRCLITSRRPIRRTSRLPLGPLALQDARELFVQRARAVGRDTAAEPRAIEELVELLDRNPLAIELAAARARGFGPAALARHLRQDPLPALDGLAATLRWSWDQLGDRRRHLAALVAFPGSFDAESAAAVLDDPGVVRILDELLDHG